MNRHLAIYIARRYFIEKIRQKNKKRTKNSVFSGKNFVRFLTNLSMFGVCIGTAALIVVLSVFNGLETLTREQFSLHNAELKITATQGKSFPCDTLLLKQITALEGVEALTQVIEDNALIRYKTEQVVANVKGVSDNFLAQTKLEDCLIAGTFSLRQGTHPRMILGAGVAFQLSLNLADQMNPIQVWYPKRDRKLSLNPEKSFYRRAILPGGMFSLAQSYDFNNVLVPLNFMEKMLKYEGRRTSLEIKTTNSVSPEQLKPTLEHLLGNTYQIKTREEQQATILRAVKLERLFGFVTFALILAIASFNVFFSLAIVTIEKKRDIATLFTLGATPRLIRHIFLCEGLIIAILGGGTGLLLGFLVCLLQQQFGIVSLGVSSAVVDAYPVRMKTADFLFSALTVFLITLAAAYLPAQKASKLPIVPSL